MSKTHLIAAVAVTLFLRWLATGHVALSIAGAVISVPALLVVAVTVVAVTGAAAAVVIARTRAELAMLAARQAQEAGAR
jgi:ABC-type uncharacterized transport system fused permease/ATPase subunit